MQSPLVMACRVVVGVLGFIGVSVNVGVAVSVGVEVVVGVTVGSMVGVGVRVEVLVGTSVVATNSVSFGPAEHWHIMRTNIHKAICAFRELVFCLLGIMSTVMLLM